MNILYINHYAGSPKHGMEYRPYYLSKEWTKLGHKITIVSSSYSHLRLHQPSIKKGGYHEEEIDGISYIWLKTNKYNLSNLARIKNIILFVIKLFYYKKLLAKVSNPDVVIASSTYPLDIYPAYLISKSNKSKLIFELHDMWPLSPMIIGGYSKNHPYIKLMQLAENFACRKSDGYISMLGNAEDYLIKHGLKKGKFIHVSNGFYEEEWSNSLTSDIPQKHKELLSYLKSGNKTIIGYAGGHSSSNSLSMIIEAAKKINIQEIAIVLIGNGPSKQELIDKASNYKLNNIYFLPAIEKKFIPSILNYFDIAFIGGVKNKLHFYGTSPNKVIDYMLAGLPIIFAIDEPNNIVQTVGCGIQTPAENSEKLVETINLLMSLPISERIEMGKKGKEYAVKNLNYRSLALKAINAIESY